MPPMTRRAVLSASGFGLITTLAGCQSLSMLGSEKRHMIEIENYSTEPRSFFVKIIDEFGDVLDDHEVTIQAGKQVTSVFAGAPVTIHVRVGNQAEDVFDWPTPSCSDGDPAPKTEISYGMATSMEDTLVFGRCEEIPSE